MQPKGRIDPQFAASEPISRKLGAGTTSLLRPPLPAVFATFPHWGFTDVGNAPLRIVTVHVVYKGKTLYDPAN